MNMHCDNIANEQQLYDVFHSRIPFPKFYRLDLDTSNLETLSDNAFGEATFSFVSTRGEGILKFVDPKAFIKSESTLRYLTLWNNKVSSFPYDTLGLYKKLESLTLMGNPISSFPFIESETLKYLSLDGTLIEKIPDTALGGISNLESLSLGSTLITRFPIIKCQTLTRLQLHSTRIDEIPSDALDGLPNLESINLGNTLLNSFPILKSETLRSLNMPRTLIGTIPDGTLDGIPHLESIWLQGTNLDNLATGLFKHLRHDQIMINLSQCNLTHVKSHQFEIIESSIHRINLKDNQITTVDTDAFKGIQRYAPATVGYSYIDLRNNLLYTLPEATWRPVLEADILLKLEGNSLTCGCDVAWLVSEPNFHKLVADARCHSGQLLVELDPQIFQLFCSK